MSPHNLKWIARIALLVLVVLGGLWLVNLDFKQKISTDITDLIPIDERSPEVSLLHTLLDERQSRVALFVLKNASDEAAGTFINQLSVSGYFSEVAPMADETARNEMGRFLYEHRMELLFPSWLAQQRHAFVLANLPESDFAAWLANRVVKNLDSFLTRPEANAFQELVPSDPLLLVPDFALSVSAVSSLGTKQQNGEHQIWARLKLSPFAESGQDPVFQAVADALKRAQSISAGAELQWTAINRFAASSRERIRSELSWLNICSLAAVLGLAVTFVRKPWKALHLAPVILFSLLSGWVGATLCFERLHILVFVVGALLTGVAIDYGFYLYLQPPLYPGETYVTKLKRLFKPLITSCLTTIIGFSFLLFSDMPLIRQLGVFVSCGLLGALIAAILYFGQIRNPYLESRLNSGSKKRNRHKGLRVAGVIALAVVALGGPWFLSWHDDIHELDMPDPALVANDQQVRSQFGENEETQSIYITQGYGLIEARRKLEQFRQWHDARHPDANVMSLGFAIPTQVDFTAAHVIGEQLREFPQLFQAALTKAGYEADSFGPFIASWDAFVTTPTDNYEELATLFQSYLKGPMGMLFFSEKGRTWFISFAGHAPVVEDPPAATGTMGTSQLQNLNNLFSRYRRSAMNLSLGGLAVIGLSVFLLYGIRRGFHIFMIPAGACFFTLGLLGISGQTLNLFHLLGAFLGVCLSHNYAIFSAENANRGESTPVSIRLSALTTACSFGVLAFSRIPVVSALGMTVSLIVISALLIVELGTLTPRKAA